MGLVTETKA